MFSSDLLRIRINRGKVTPLFCTSDFGNGTDYELANKMIVFFANAQKNKQHKGDLLQKVNRLESEHDYKLVRGLLGLLERRSIFSPLGSSSTIVTPSAMRKKLFEESSKMGLALSDSRRQHVIQKVANQTHLSPEDVEDVMWGDKDENLLLTQFDAIGPKDLILVVQSFASSNTSFQMHQVGILREGWIILETSFTRCQKIRLDV